MNPKLIGVVVFSLLGCGLAWGADKEANEALRLSPQFANTFGTRGECYQNLREYAKAIDDYTAALKYAPQNSSNFPLWYSARGICFYGLGSKQEDALQDLDKAIELNPKNAQSYGVRGLVKIELNKDDEAKKDLAKCYELDPNKKKVFESLAEKTRAKRNEKK